MNEHADVVVVGMGPGGEQVAEDLAAAGLEVVGVEGRLVGGECPYWGCIPSKAMVRAGDALAEGRRIPQLAGEAQVRARWAPVAGRVRELTDDWDDTAAVERFEDKGGRFVRGWARLEGPGEVSVGDRRISASRAVVLAPGSQPWAPPIPGLAEVDWWSNREAIEATEVPSSLLVLGGGAVGVELAQVMARFGCSVRVVEAAPRLLPAEEPEASDLVTEVLLHDGLEVHTGVGIERVSAKGAVAVVELADGQSLEAERLLVATGRRSDLAALGVGRLGLDERQRALPVDGRMRVAPGVWAVGDVTGKGAFTHMAVYQARIAIDDILGRPVTEADYRAVPRVTFSDPEVGSVGLTEAAARDQGLRVTTALSPLAESARGYVHGPGNHGLIKLVADADRKVLVGATSIGPMGGEVLSVLTLAVFAEIPLPRLRSMIYAYPTFHRAIEGPLAALGL